MNAKTIEKPKVIESPTTFLTIKAYCEQTGLSYATVDHMCKSGQLQTALTASGKRRIVLNREGTNDALYINRKLEQTEVMLRAICEKFNVSYSYKEEN